MNIKRLPADVLLKQFVYRMSVETAERDELVLEVITGFCDVKTGLYDSLSEAIN